MSAYVTNGADTNRLKPIPFDEDFTNQLNLGEKKLFTRWNSCPLSRFRAYYRSC